MMAALRRGGMVMGHVVLMGHAGEAGTRGSRRRWLGHSARLPRLLGWFDLLHFFLFLIPFLFPISYLYLLLMHLCMYTCVAIIYTH